MCLGQARVGWVRVGGPALRSPDPRGPRGVVKRRRGPADQPLWGWGGLAERYLQVVQTELAGQREAGELCGEGKRKPWGEGDGDGVGVGAGGLEPRRRSHFTSPGFGL